MKHATLLLAAAGLLAGAFAELSAAETPATKSATQPATQAATRPVLKPVDVRTGVYLFRSEVHTTISPDGLLRREWTSNKSYGPKDIDPKLQRTEVRQGQLTPEQMAE